MTLLNPLHGLPRQGCFARILLAIYFAAILSHAGAFDAWKYSARIQINTTSSGANVSGSVTNFPLLIRLDANNFIFSQAHISGNDIRFEDPDGSSLSYHIERWDATRKVAEVWVKVPQVDGGSNLDYVNMYWGNASASAASNGTGVFSGYVAVWHLGESPGGSAPQFTDASGNANHGTAQAGAAGDTLTSAIGLGFKLDGGSKFVTSAVSFANPTTVTTGGWFKTTTTLGGGIMSFGYNQTTAAGDRDRALWMDNTGKLSFGTFTGSNNVVTSTSAYNDGQWHHAAGRISAAGTYLFVDGVSVASNGTTASQNYTGYWRGGYWDFSTWTPAATSFHFNGTVDELWASHSELSADYIKLSYETQKSGTTVLTYPNTALSTWSYSTKVFVNTTATGARVSANLSNFPLLVRLTAANFNFAQAGSDGRDLRFADSAGNLLAYDIERFDATNKLAEVWVLLPTVYGNNNSQWFRMYWGKGTATSLSSPNSVFDVDNNFVVNYHMSGASGSMQDATAYGNPGTGAGNVPNQVDGMIGKAQDFDGDGDWFSGGTASNLDVAANDKVTLSAWVRRDGAGVTGHEEGILGKFEWNSGDYRCYAIDYHNGTGFKFILSSAGSGASETVLIASSYNFITNGTWYHVAAVADNATMKLYLNGVQVASQAYSGGIFATTNAPLKVGQLDDDGITRQYWNGIIDEPSVSNTNRGADWIKLSYETQKSGSTVVSLGARPGDYSNTLRLNFNTTASGANVSGNVTNIPILVKLTSANFTFSAARDDGADLKFVDKDGTALYHDVAEWDKANKVGKVWVRVPQVDGNSTTDFISLYYGCSSCSGNPYAVSDSVWSAYAGVFHLAAPEAQARDAGKNGYHGTYQRNQAFMTGITSSLAPLFDGANDYIQTAVPTTAGTRTFSAWIYPRSSDNVTTVESIIDGDVSGQYGTGFGLDNGAFTVILDNEFWGTAKAVTLNAWQHVVLKFNATNAVLYHNGASAATLAYTQGSISSTTLRLGRSMVNAEYFDGAIQEVQMLDSYASDDYVKLSYENQKEGSLLFSTSGITTASFTSSKVFKFNTTASGANIAGDVYNFPLLLRLTGSTILDAVRPNAPDIRFLDADGVTWLDYSIERWDNGTKDSAEVWVRVPKIDGNSAGDFITLYYNDVIDDAVPDGQCAACVFDASQFKAVYHLNENAASAAVADARGAYNGTFMQTASSDNTSNHFTDGMVGTGGLNFNGTSDWIDLGSNSSMVQNVPGATLSGWFKPSTFATTTRALVHLSYNPDKTASRIRLYTNTSGYLQGGGRSTDSESLTNPTATTQQLTTGNWYHIAAITDYANSSVAIYVNGTRATVSAATFGAALSSNTTSAGTVLGARADGTTDFYGGIMDEVQISGVPLDTNWVKLSYQSQRRDASPLFNPSPADFVSSRKLRFNTTRTGANVTGDVENFPMLVRFTGSTLVDAVQDDYDDIRFLDGDGKTWLQYQVERWDKAVDSAEVWVLVPKVDGNSDQDFITVYYNDVTDGAVPSGQCATCVFATSNSFAGVWHLNDAANNDAGNYKDATSNAYHGTGSNMWAGLSVGGMIGKATELTNWIERYIDVGTSAGSTAAQTVSFWMKNDDSTSFQAALSKEPNSSSGTGWCFKLRRAGTTADDSLAIWYRVGSETPEPSYAEYFSDAKKARGWTQGQWVHVTGTFDGSGNQKLYVNGALADTKTGVTQSVNDDTTRLRFGAPAAINQTEAFKGTLDEVVIASAARDANWIKLVYETQRGSGNVFWNSRPGPNNKVILTATPGSGAISLTWSSAVSDSSNADSIGIWLKYSGTLDSVGATGQTKVVILPKTDSAYSYPATYTGTYVFGLAVRNTSGQWSPFTAVSIDTVKQTGYTLTDTIYVDSAIGTASGGTAASCTNARNPSTPLAELEDAVWCAQASGFTPNDTLVVRVMPGTYASASDNELEAPSSYPVVVTSFDLNSRPVLASSTHSGYTLQLGNLMTLRRMNVRAATHASAGIQIKLDADSVVIDGCRIFNHGNTKLDTGIVIPFANNEGVGIFNNLIHEPNKYGVYLYSDDRANIINNTLVGSGAAGTKGIYMPRNAFGAGFLTITNNIFFNWDYGIHTTDSDWEIGTVSSNFFELITSGQEIVGESDLSATYIDPQFHSKDPGDRNGYKLLPGSWAIDAGTSTINTQSSESSWSRIPNADHFGNSRPQGLARDIGMYEGSGYTSNPTGTFDSLTNTVSGNTVIVKNSRFKLVWDMARGGGITGFYDMTGDTTANLVGSNSLLFDIRIDGMVASAATSNTFAPYFVERTRAKAVVRQRLAVSASLDLNVTYSVHPSGHVYIQSEIDNLSSSIADVDLVQYSLKMGSATAVTQSLGSLADITFPYGHVYLTSATKDPLLAAARWLDEQTTEAEVWSQTGSVSGSLDSAGWSIPDHSDLPGYMQRHHHFLLYVGENSLDASKASALAADVWSPSEVKVSSGSLPHERSWQDGVAGHWTFDDGGGATVKDKSLLYTNHGTAISGAWVSGHAGGAMRFTTASVVSVADADALEAAKNRTYMLWVKPDYGSMGDDAFLLSKGLTPFDGWHFRRVSGEQRFKFVMGTVEVLCPIWSASNVWMHLAATVDGAGQVKLYVDGVLEAASTTSATLTTNASALRMGENAGSGAADRFVGDIDDVRIYHRVVPLGALQAIVASGFSSQWGHYHLRADNNNRVVALLNDTIAQTRMQPSFRIDNWFGPKTPKYVYLNGTRLIPNVDFVSDSARDQGGTWDFGPYLYLQVNKTLTGSSQTLFVDDDDSSGYLGEAAKMKSLTVAATANDKIAIQNFSGSTFGSASSGQWYMELDLNGWTTSTRTTLTDTGFGEINVWKAAAVSPNVAVTSATQMVGWGPNTGRSLSYLKLDGTAGPNETYSVGTGYSSSANLTYTLTDSSSTRLSLTLSAISLSGEGTASVSKRFTFYPTGRAYVSYTVSGATADFDTPRLDLNPRYSGGLTSTAWTTATAAANARWALMGGNLDYHSIGFALLSVKNAAATYTAAASMVGSAATASASGASNDQNTAQFLMPTSIWTSANNPVTVNFMMDFSKDFTDSATADSLLKDAQTPAAITAITGTATTNDALDLNADGFAEGDGAYVYTASSGIAHFKFVNTVAHFSPAFRIKSWSVASLPEYIMVDNQTLVKDYHYNAYVNTASNELIVQFSKTFQPGTHVFYISYMNSLAVTLNRFEAVAGEGVDTLKWATESEFENLGFNVWRRLAPIQSLPGSESVAYQDVDPMPGVSGRLKVERARPARLAASGGQAAGASPAAKAAADSLPSHGFTVEELQALGYVRLNAKLIPGAPGGSSVSTREYVFVDRTAAFGNGYEYLLEAVDFQGAKVQYGPRLAAPVNPLETALLPNYPNPFNPVTTLRFSLKEQSKVSLLIFDARGRLVRTLIRPDKTLLPGKYRLIWNARDDAGFEMPSGQYFYRFKAGRFSKTRKMVYVK